MSPLIALTLLLLATQIFDWYSTQYSRHNGTGKESNPLDLWFMDRIGVDTFLGLKTVFVTGLGYIVGYFMLWLLVADVAWYVVVLINNVTLVVTGKGLFERIVAKFKK